MRQMTIQFALFHATICIISCVKTRHIANRSLLFYEIAILCLFFVAWDVTSLLAFFMCIFCYIRKDNVIEACWLFKKKAS